MPTQKDNESGHSSHAEPPRSPASARVTPVWTCAAYGSEGLTLGLVCFFSDGDGRRSCDSRPTCVNRMTAERDRVSKRVQELAAEGHPDWVALARDIRRPEDLSGGFIAAVDE